MKLSEFTKYLSGLSELNFELPDGRIVPKHFHLTEIGKISKNFIDCGGSLRNEEKISFQLFEATDYDHRLHPEKIMKIIDLAKEQLSLNDSEVEVEYQSDSISKYGLDFNGKNFLLVATNTNCLAKDKCGIPAEKPKRRLSELQKGACAPGSGCC